MNLKRHLKLIIIFLSILDFNFSSKFKHANIFSVILFLISIILIAFKGLNYGIDFKGGTLIELRSINTEASSIRDTLKVQIQLLIQAQSIYQ